MSLVQYTGLQWIQVSTSTPILTANVTLTKIGYTVTLNVETPSAYTVFSTPINMGQIRLTIPSVASMYLPLDEIYSTVSIIYTNPSIDSDVNQIIEKATLNIVGSDLVVTIDMGLLKQGLTTIGPIYFTYCTTDNPVIVVGPTAIKVRLEHKVILDQLDHGQATASKDLKVILTNGTARAAGAPQGPRR